MTLLGMPVRISQSVPNGVIYRAGGGPLVMNARSFALLMAVLLHAAPPRGEKP